MTTTDFNPIRGRRRTIKKPTKMRIKTRQPRKKRSKMIFKKKKKKIKTRTAKAYQLQRWSHTTKTKGLPKHTNCRGGTKLKMRNHRHFATTKEVKTRSKQKYQVERILMQKISALHRPRSRKHLYDKKIQMRTKACESLHFTTHHPPKGQ
jgi:hypothetical protein